MVMKLATVKLNHKNPNIREKQKQGNTFCPCLQGFRMHRSAKIKQMSRYFI